MPSDIVPPVPETLGDKLALQEFEILRGEIEQRSSEGRAMERNVMIVSSVIYGFLLTPKIRDIVQDAQLEHYRNLAWYLPSFLNFLALVR